MRKRSIHGRADGRDLAGGGSKAAPGGRQEARRQRADAVCLAVPPGTMGVAGTRVDASHADTYLLQHATSINAIEHVTGLHFLASLTNTQQHEVAFSTPTVLWPK